MGEVTNASIFIENLLQFCLEKRGIAWEPVPRDIQIEEMDMIFNETIGNAVLTTSSSSPQTMEYYTRVLWDDLRLLKGRGRNDFPARNVSSTARGIYNRPELGDSKIEDTYTFLAVMVEVSIRCVENGKLWLVQAFVSIIPDILDREIPNGFLHNINRIATYAENLVNPAGLAK